MTGAPVSDPVMAMGVVILVSVVAFALLAYVIGNR